MNGRKDEKEERRMGQREVGTGEGQGGGEGGKRDGGSVGRKKCVALGRLEVSLEEDVKHITDC